jgi:hypothetical protein
MWVKRFFSLNKIISKVEITHPFKRVSLLFNKGSQLTRPPPWGGGGGGGGVNFCS